MNYIYSEDEIYERVEMLNMIQDQVSKWREVKARKEHVDEFGVKITKNELYYKRELGSSYDYIKLSRKSMDKFLYVLFNRNNRLQNVTRKLLEDKRQDFAKKMNDLFSGSDEEE